MTQAIFYIAIILLPLLFILNKIYGSNQQRKGKLIYPHTISLNTPSRFTIIGDGEFAPEKLIQTIAHNTTIIALDGAVDQIAKLHNIQPHIILGDFDSIQTPEKWGINPHKPPETWPKPYHNNQQQLIVPTPHQNHTDLEKALAFCIAQQASYINIICATGRRMDHTLTNIFALSKFHTSQHPILLHTTSNTLIFAHNQTITIHGNPKDHCGIMPLSKAMATSTNLKYPLKQYRMQLGQNQSSSNQLLTKTATIKIQGKALIIAPHQLDYTKATTPT